jgi:hypothetical protein
VFTEIGAGALAAASTKLAAVRPPFLVLTTVLLGFCFYRTYRAPEALRACGDGSCAPGANRRARVILWIVAVVVALFAAFPYYAEYLF